MIVNFKYKIKGRPVFAPNLTTSTVPIYQSQDHFMKTRDQQVTHTFAQSKGRLFDNLIKNQQDKKNLGPGSY